MIQSEQYNLQKKRESHCTLFFWGASHLCDKYKYSEGVSTGVRYI
jgi:hypothetical protein